MKLEIIKSQRASLVSKKFLKDFLQFVEKTLVKKHILPSSSNKKLVIAFVSAKEIQKLNKQFLTKDYITDVLSFAPSQEDPFANFPQESVSQENFTNNPVKEDSFGELALCMEKIKSQAREHKLSVEEETAYLVLHGFLHLLGYHHEQGGEPAQKMYKIQNEIFNEWQNLILNKGSW